MINIRVRLDADDLKEILRGGVAIKEISMMTRTDDPDKTPVEVKVEHAEVQIILADIGIDKILQIVAGK